MKDLTASATKYFEAATEKAKVYQRASRSKDQRARDIWAWQHFSNFLGSADPWRASDEDVAAWCARLASENYHFSTIRIALGCLSYTYSVAGKGNMHGKFGAGIRSDNPVTTELVRATMRGIKLVRRQLPVRKLPIELPTLEKLIDVQPDTAEGVRNRAMFALAWSAALKNIELTRLDIGRREHSQGYVDIQDDGLVVHFIRHAGSELGHVWQAVCVPSRKKADHCPRTLLNRWLEIYQPANGPLFPQCRNTEIRYGKRLNGYMFTVRLKKSAGLLGLPQERYGGLSLRRGCLEWLSKEGIPEAQLLRHACLRQPESAAPYTRPSAEQNSAFAQTDW